MGSARCASNVLSGLSTWATVYIIVPASVQPDKQMQDRFLFVKPVLTAA